MEPFPSRKSAECMLERVTDDIDLILSKGIISSYLNPYQYLKLRNRSDLTERIDYFVFDGFLLAKLFKVFGLGDFKSVAPDFSGFFGYLFKKIAKEKSRIYLIGSSQEVIEKVVEVLHVSYPGLNIAGFRNGYFADRNDFNNSIEEIGKTVPDYVLVGMGAINQENFLVNLKRECPEVVGIACGGFFHQTTRSISYYPKFFQRNNLRWAYRIIQEPKLIKRYFLIYPWAGLLFAYDLLRR